MKIRFDDVRCQMVVTVFQKKGKKLCRVQRHESGYEPHLDILSPGGVFGDKASCSCFMRPNE